jgi:hypothetical protein
LHVKLTGLAFAQRLADSHLRGEQP